MTPYQKAILKKCPELEDKLHLYADLKEETGTWSYDESTKILAEGGEAIVYSEKFDDLETAVRIQPFDPYLFTENFWLKTKVDLCLSSGSEHSKN